MKKENRKINKVILNLIQDLQRLLGSFSNGVRRRCQIKFGMTSYVRGFTLIEILVVVVIIAVLAAIAVPAYQKAVLKSRFSSLIPTTKAIRDGNEMYYMTNGGYADALAKLDVTTANTEDMTITLSDDDDYTYTMATRPNINNNLIMYQKHSVNFPGEIHCEAKDKDTHAEWLCGTALHGTQNLGEVITEGYNTYVLEGTGDGLNRAQLEALADAPFCEYALSKGYTCDLTKNEDGRVIRKLVCFAERSLGVVGTEPVCYSVRYAEDGSYDQTICYYDGEKTCYDQSIRRYDKNGNLIYASKCTGRDQTGKCFMNGTVDADFYTYDEKGNMTSKRYCTKVTTVQSQDKQYCNSYKTYNNVDYKYNEKGQLEATFYCKSTAAFACNTYSGATYYTYDTDGNKTKERACSAVATDKSCTQYSNTQTEYKYDEKGNQIGKRACAQVIGEGDCGSYSSGTDFIYDTTGKQIGQRECQTISSTGICTKYYAGSYWESDDEDDWLVYYKSYDYTYDENGIYTSQCATMNANGNCTSYSYTSYATYDENGNKTFEGQCKSRAADGTCTAYFSAQGYTYSYDDAGNKLSQATCKTWNATKTECTTWNTPTTYY